MPTVLTLAQAAARINDEIGRGIVQTVVKMNPLYNILPYTPFSGQSLTVTPVDQEGNVEAIDVGDIITADAPTTYDSKTFFPTTLIGKINMNGLVQVTSIGAGDNELTAQIAQKARNIGMQFQQHIATGTGIHPSLHSLRSLAAGSQTVDGEGAAISFEMLDELADKVRSKGRQCDAFVMPTSCVRQVKALLRASGGTSMVDLNGVMVEAVDGIPVLRNDYLSVSELADGTEDAMGDKTSIYAVNFDDGTRTTGISAIYPAASLNMGFNVTYTGEDPNYDNEVYKIKQYVGFANFADLGLARVRNVSPKAV